jgi:hypothetical protein
VIAAIGDAGDNGKKIPSRQARRFDRKDFDKSCDRRSCDHKSCDHKSCDHKSCADRSFDRELCAGRGRPSPRQSDPREHAVAAPIVRAADAAAARSHRPRRRAEAEYSYRHELPVLRGGDNVVHGKAQAVSGCAPCSRSLHAWARRRGRMCIPVSAPFAHPMHLRPEPALVQGHPRTFGQKLGELPARVEHAGFHSGFGDTDDLGDFFDRFAVIIDKVDDFGMRR